MKHFGGIIRLSLVLAVLAIACLSPMPVQALGTTITVNTTQSSATLNGNCDIREAIQAANTNAVVDKCPAGTGKDTIAFHIGTGAKTITLASSLSITSPVIIDGTTQPGYAGVPLIRLTSTSASLLWLQAGSGGSTIRGLMVTFTGALGAALTINSANSIHIVGNYFNTNGTGVVGNSAFGVSLNPASSTVIGTAAAADRNLFGGSSGVVIEGGSSNKVQGNYFGVTAGGSTALNGRPMDGTAIAVWPSGATASNTIRGNVITGFYEGIDLQKPTHDNTVAGNYIGLGADGSTPLGNGAGVAIEGGVDNIIGGVTAADRNVISGNINANIQLNSLGGITPDGNQIRGNYIGTNASGTAAVATATTYGVDIEDGELNTIGGAAAGYGNVISGNSTGIKVSNPALGTVIRSNKIGVNAAGTGPISNTTGIILVLGAPALISGNWIGYNAADGLDIASTSTVAGSSTQNCFSSNAAYGVSNVTGVSAPLTGNWWGSSTGPMNAGNPGGTGDLASNDVNYSGFLTTNPAACPVLSLLQNADFETDANLDLKPDNWAFANFKPATDGRDCAVRKTGSCSLRFAGNNTQKIASQSILKGGLAHDDFTFSLWSKATAVPAGAIYRLQVLFYNGAALQTTKTMNFAVGTHGFQKVSGSLTTTFPYTRIVFRIVFKAASGKAWFDTSSLRWAP